jgi:prolipoprotein diacylglyceryl transferase
MIPLATIPSPAQGVWHLGPLPLRAYALCILLGIALAIVIGQRRWKARGGDPVVVMDIATWAVPFGVIGGRVYHVITSPQAYFGANGDPVKAFYIWEGGLGIWGAVVLGGVGAWIGCRRNGVKLPPFGDAVAPGVVLAQAIGRWGNWFNNELYGRATDAPWGLEIHQWDSSAGAAVKNAAGDPVLLGTFQPTFLYESIWDILTAIILILADRRWKLGHGRVFALYVAVYSLGRGWIEVLRIDEANHILGLRLNVWTSVVVFSGGLIYFIVSAWRRPGRETEVMRKREVAGKSAVDGEAKESDTPASSKDAGDEKDSTEKDSTEKVSTEKDSTEKDSKDGTEKGSTAGKDGVEKVSTEKAGKDSAESVSTEKASTTKASTTKDSTTKDSTTKDSTTKDSKDSTESSTSEPSKDSSTRLTTSGGTGSSGEAAGTKISLSDPGDVSSRT